MGMLRVPLTAELSGDGWKLTFETTLADPSGQVTLQQFKVSRPFDNPLGKTSRLGYVPCAAIPKPAGDQLVDGQTQSGSLSLKSLYADRANEGKVVYGTTTLTVESPVTVKFEFGRNCLFYVNGKSVGTTLGRGQWGFVRLEQGENRLEMLMRPTKDDDWRIALPRITWIEKTTVFGP